MSDEKKHQGSVWIKLGMALLLVVLLANSWMIWQMRGVVERVDKYNQGVVDEIGGVTGDVKNFAEDLNEIRRFLLLPEKNYSVGGQADVGEAELSPEAQNNLAIFAMLDSLTKEKKSVENNQSAQTAMTSLLVNQDFLKGLTAVNLQLGERADLQIKFNDTLAKNPDGSDNPWRGQPLFSLAFDSENNLFRLQSVLGEQSFPKYQEAEFPSKVLDYLTANSQSVRNKKSEKVTQEALDKQKAEDAAKQDLQNRRISLDTLVNDKAFQDTLVADGWQMVSPAREEANKYIYDFKDAQGKVVFSLAVELSSGMIKMLRNGQELDVQSFLNSEGSKKKT